MVDNKTIGHMKLDGTYKIVLINQYIYKYYDCCLKYDLVY